MLSRGIVDLAEGAKSLVTGQFNESYYPIVDGVALATRNYALQLNTSLGPSWVVAPGVPGHHDDEPFGVVRYPSFVIPGRAPYRTGFPRLVPGMVRRLSQIPFNLVHAHSPFSAGRLALWIARRRGIPIVGTFHSKYRDNFNQLVPIKSFVDWQVRRLIDFYSQLDEVWVPSEPTVEVLREYGFTKPIEVARNGTDFEIGDIDRLDLDGFSRTWGVGSNEIVLLYVGQLVWEKNLRLLLEALQRLRSHGRAFKMVFVGQGYARAEMEQSIGNMGLESSVHFTGPILNREDLKSWFARAELFLFPSLYDISPLVIREAAAFGLPAVMVKGSTISDGVFDGVNGFLSENRSEALAAKLDEILDRPDAIRIAGTGAMKTLQLSWKEVLLEVKDRYLALIVRRTSL